MASPRDSPRGATWAPCTTSLYVPFPIVLLRLHTHRSLGASVPVGTAQLGHEPLQDLEACQAVPEVVQGDRVLQQAVQLPANLVVPLRLRPNVLLDLALAGRDRQPVTELPEHQVDPDPPLGVRAPVGPILVLGLAHILKVPVETQTAPLEAALQVL